MQPPGATPADTQERFLREIAARIDPALIVEVHLFPPIRQGGIESGVAVIAATQPTVEDATRGTVADDSVTSLAGGEEIATVPASDEPIAGGVAVAEDAVIDELVLDDLVSEDSGDEDVDAERSSPRAERFTVYTAHYRHVLKGPDRGKWEADATPEAEAPLATVDAVVRGVQRRAGEAMDAERLGGDAFRSAIGIDVAAPAASEG